MKQLLTTLGKIFSKINLKGISAMMFVLIPIGVITAFLTLSIWIDKII